MTVVRLVVVGDALLDRDLDGTVVRLAPDAPVPVVDSPETRSRPGGAGLAALLAAGDGLEIVLVTALGSDAAGRELAALLGDAGVTVVDLGLDGRTPEKVRVLAAGRALLRIDHGGEPGPVGIHDLAPALTAIAGASAVLVSDYGRGVAASEPLRRALADLPRRVPVVWDPHPRGPEPVPGLHLATPNEVEAARSAPEVLGTGMAATAARARALVERWGATTVAVTRGAGGALMAGRDGPPLVVPAPAVVGGDPCGAGDRFAAAAACAMAAGALPSEAVVEAVRRASAFVAAGGAGGVLERAPALPGPSGPSSATEVVARVRATGGTVVATGGCFDLLHAGHVSVLQAARALGDCLVVLLNSDESVRRLKGPERPLQSEGDRAAVLLALDCVDAVEVFGGETPVPVLERLRPDLFAKGADYAAADLPEAATMASWGGTAVVLPYLPGRSTSRLVEEARRGG